jgi:hypothetical protein
MNFARSWKTTTCAAPSEENASQGVKSKVMQELYYLVTADDIAYLNHYHAQKSPTMRRNRAVVGTCLTIMGVVGFSFAMATTGMGMLLMLILIVMGVWVAIGKRGGPTRQQREHIRRLFDEGRNRALFGHHHIKLLEDRIEVSTEYSRGEVKWEGVERVEEDENYIFLYVSALNAYVINKKYFASEEGARQFFLTAEQLHQNALMLEGGQTFKALPSPHPSTQRGPVPSTQTMAPSPMPRMPQASPGRLLPQGGGTGTDGTI